MAIKTVTLDQNEKLPQSLLDQFDFKLEEPLKAVCGRMGVLLLKKSASLSDILLALEEIKNIYRNEIRDLDKEWDDFTLAEEWLGTDLL